MTDPNCLFCKIVTGEIKGEVIMEDEHALAFLDIHPRAGGHTMVIPKHHAPTLVELPGPEVAPLFETVQKVAKRLMDRLAPDGLTIGANQGRVSGQEVDHLHIHLIPRYNNDHGGSVQSVVNNPPQESLRDIKEKLTA